jgi:hypothetical protein
MPVSTRRSSRWLRSAALLVGLALVPPLAALGAQQVAAPPTPEQIAQRHREEDERLRTDWAGLRRYAQANAELPPPRPDEQRVVFLGNSITEGWARHFPAMFPGKPYVNRGVGGQTTPRMRVRFRQDAVALRPAMVVILAGPTTSPATPAPRRSRRSRRT